MTDFQREREALGLWLSQLRRDAGLNGKSLSDAAGWHPAKTTRIEGAKQAEPVHVFWVGLAGSLEIQIVDPGDERLVRARLEVRVRGDAATRVLDDVRRLVAREVLVGVCGKSEEPDDGRGDGWRESFHGRTPHG